MTSLVRVTRKGQATIPKKLREKFGIRDRVVVSETGRGILIRAAPEPADDYGSLRKLFVGKTAREVLAQARAEDAERERRLLARAEK